MGKVLYSAMDEKNQSVEGFIEALNNRDAIEKLKSQGLNQIKLHGDASLFDQERDIITWLDKKTQSKIARKHLQIQKTKLTFGSYLSDLLQSSFFPIALGGGVTYWGYMEHSYIWASIGTITAFAPLFFGLWNYRLARNFDNLLKSYAYGEFDKALELAYTLKEESKMADLVAYADFVIAVNKAKEGELDEAIKILQSYSSDFETKPGLFQSRLATLYFAAGQYESFCYHHKQAYLESQQPVMLLDWLLAEVMVGDHKVIEQYIDQIAIEELPQYGVPYIDFVKGYALYKEGKLSEAKSYLESAQEGFLEYQENPAVWAILALSCVVYALVHYDLGEVEEAKAQINEGVEQIIVAHGDKKLLEELRKRFAPQFGSV